MAGRLHKHSLGWIGLGRMGLPIAQRLLKAGAGLAGYNRTRTRAEPLGDEGGALVARRSISPDATLFSPWSPPPTISCR